MSKSCRRSWGSIPMAWTKTQALQTRQPQSRFFEGTAGFHSTSLLPSCCPRAPPCTHAAGCPCLTWVVWNSTGRPRAAPRLLHLCFAPSCAASSVHAMPQFDLCWPGLPLWSGCLPPTGARQVHCCYWRHRISGPGSWCPFCWRALDVLRGTPATQAWPSLQA